MAGKREAFSFGMRGKWLFVGVVQADLGGLGKRKCGLQRIFPFRARRTRL
jgi:hypothetical protein